MAVFFLILILTIHNNAYLYAEIILDDTIVSEQSILLENNEFQINSSHGKQIGSNIFHSFQKFNIEKGETAFFNYSEQGIQNIISRVTGGQSTIDGTLKSNIPANFFLLNPSGIMFGSSAKLEINGSFHVGASDYLQVGNHQFSINTDIQTLSISAKPSEFGFISDETNKHIQIHSSNLSVEAGFSISFVANDIDIQDSKIEAPDGQINIAGLSVNHPIEPSFLAAQEIGNVQIQKSRLITTGKGAGDIFIRGGEICVKQSLIDSQCKGILTPDDTIQAGNSGNIYFAGTDMLFDQSEISSSSLSGENAGKIKLYANNRILFSDSHISTEVNNKSWGDAGNIHIQSQHISFLQGSSITSLTGGPNNAGNIDIEASTIIFSGINSNGYAAELRSSSHSKENDAGNSGLIVIKGDDILFNEGAAIYSETEGPGQGGDIKIEAQSGIVRIIGHNPCGETFTGFYSGFFSESKMSDENGGKAGDIIIQTQSLSLLKGGTISTSTYGGGDGGKITINAGLMSIDGKTDQLLQEARFAQELFMRDNHNEVQQIDASGLYSQSISDFDSAGDAGIINVTCDNLFLTNKGTISTSSTGGGNAGRIDIHSSQSIRLIQNGQITATAKRSGGGQISIHSDELIYMSDSQISSSVSQGAGMGGDININSNILLVNKGEISAKAYNGDGGAIYVKNNHFLKSSDTLISATSERGNDGIVQIESPDLEITSDMVQLANNILNAEIWVNDRCNERTGDNISHLIVKTKYGRPHSPEDWLSGHYPFPDDCNMFQWAAFETFIHFGKWDDAVQWLEKYAYQIDPTKDLSLYCAFYINIAALYQQSGHFDKAIDVLKIIMKIIPKTNCHYSKALFYLCMGDISLSLGNTDFEEFDIDPNYKYFSEYFFEKGLHEAKSDGRPEVKGLAFLYLGNLYAVKGLYHEAITEYQNCYHACELATKSSLMKQLKTNAGINIIRAKIYQKEYVDLITFFNMVLVDIHDLPDSYDKAFRLLAICRLMHTIDDKQLNNHISPFIKEYLSKAFDMASQLNNNRLLSYTFGFIAQLLETESKYAIPLTKKAMMLAQENDQDLMFMWQWQLARLLAKQLNISDALHAYGSAIELLTPSKNIPPNCKHPCSGMLQSFLRGFRGSHLNFEKQVKPVYAAYCDLLLSQNKQEMTLKARNIMERLKSVELADYYQDECMIIKSKEIPEVLPDDAAIIYPMVLDKSLKILLTISDKTIQKTIHVSAIHIQKMARRLREMLQNPYHFSKDRYKFLAQRFYDWTIRPIEEELQQHQIKTLVIAPDNCFRLLPFAVFMDNNQYLIEKYALVTVPSLSLTDFQAKKQNSRKILLCGLSEGIPALPQVPKELTEINRIFPGQIYLNKGFNYQQIVNAFQNNYYNIVHISTHGRFEQNQYRSYLQLYKERLTINQLEKLIQISVVRQAPVDLLTLSSCYSAADNERSAMGMAGLAVKTGVQSVIASLWRISDKAAYEMMIEFYQHLKQTKNTKASSLQQAQITMIQDKIYAHPKNWAPFLLIGKWY
jgi:filamentous hemagglutinin family protein